MYNTDRDLINVYKTQLLVWIEDEPETEVFKSVRYHDDMTEVGKEWSRGYPSTRPQQPNYLWNMATDNERKRFDLRNLLWNFESVVAEQGPLRWEDFDSRLDKPDSVCYN